MNAIRIGGLALLCLSAASASAQSTGVTLYGGLDAAVTAIRTARHGSSVMRLDPGVSYGNRLGFRDTEALDNGLKALFLMEMGFAADTGALQQGGLMWGRQVYVGLSSTTGWSLTAGRQYSPLLATMVLLDATGQLYWGNTQGNGMNVFQSPKSIAGDGGHQASVRINNSVMGTWSRGGLTARAMVAAGDETTNSAGRLANLAVSYDFGGTVLAASVNGFRQYAKDIGAGVEPAWQNEWVVGAVQTFGPLRVHVGHYQFNPSETNRTPASASLLKTTSTWIGTRLSLTAADTLLVNAMSSTYWFDGPQGKGVTIGLALDHAFSKRSAAYLSYGQVNNNATGIASLLSATSTVNLPATAGTDPKALSIGLRHLF